MISELHSAEFSDVHLGHPNTPTVEILENLRREFPDTEETGKLDIIWIAGDFLDRLLHVNDPNVIEIKIWAYEFLSMCKRRKIAVRALEGTPSHDWKQMRLLLEHSNVTIGADFKYIETLSIEHIESLGIDVLYVPDEWTPDPDDTWMQVVQLLRDRGLEQVDYAIMHGNFTYQLPPVAKAPRHLPERYLAIVRKYIFIGHVHLSSRYERILASGSFDRLAHGEEGPKGHWRVSTYADDRPDQVVFRENRNAKTYRTIDCTEMSVEDALKTLEQVHQLPHGSHVRVAAAKNDPILTSLDVLRKTYPTMHFTSKVREDTSTVQSNILVDYRSTFHQININRDNIRELVLKRVSGLTQDPRLIDRCAKRLSEIVQ